MCHRLSPRSCSSLVWAAALSTGALAFVAQPCLSPTDNRRHDALYLGDPKHKTNVFTVLNQEPRISSCEAVLKEQQTRENDGFEAFKEETRDYLPMPIPGRGQLPTHAIFGSLAGDQQISSYQLYQRPKDSDRSNVILGLVQLGGQLDGHPGVVHGGILALIVDDSLGFGFAALGVPMAVTANLTLDYRAPVPAGSALRVAAQLDRREGRKLYWKAQITSLDETLLYVEASSLYVTPKGTKNNESTH